MNNFTHSSTRYQPSLKKARGFSLVELMVALVIGLFITLGLSQLFLSMYNSASTQRNLAQFQDNQRLALTVLKNNLDQAGYFYNPAGVTSASALPALTNADGSTFPAGYGVVGKGAGTGTGATSDTINLYYQSGGSSYDGIINCQGGQAPATTATTFVNSFSVNASNQLVCTVRASGGTTSTALVIATNVNSMHILYGVLNTALTGAPSIGSYMTAAQIDAAGAAVWQNVISVQITLALTNPATGTTSTWIQTANVFH